jgi:hypothetical protein
MDSTPEVTTPEQVQERSGHQALQPPRRPPFADADLDLARRPGVARMRQPPEPWPNTRFPPERQPGSSAAPKHGRPNRRMPPVFGTAVPLRGLSGAVRRLAYRYPDHFPRHWFLMIFGDRVDSWELRGRRALPVLLPLAAVGYLARLLKR